MKERSHKSDTPHAYPLLSVQNLRIETLSGRPVVHGVSFSLGRGEVLGIVGESGSGKTTTALAIMGFARSGMRIAGGSVRVGQHVVALNDERAARRLRGSVISHVPQDPGTNLNPSRRIAGSLADMLIEHGRPAGEAQILEALRRVDLPGQREFARRYPHQLSGGQQQRVLITNSLACSPPLVILDEPTTGLDPVTQSRVLAEIGRLHREEDVAMIYVSHDLAVIAEICDRIAVMYQGHLVEIGPAEQVLRRPNNEYTRALIAATPDHLAPRPAVPRVGNCKPVLTVDGLQAVHKTRVGNFVAAANVSFDVYAGECVALVGGSGSGKTTIARTIAGLHAPSRGTIALDGEPLAHVAKQRLPQQRRRCQIIFQNPYESLNPRQTVADEIARPAIVLRGLNRHAARVEVDSLLERVRLPARLAGKLPTELSGGERQRVAIARALAAKPDLLICDEVTSALDVLVQAAVIDLLNELRTQLGLALLFITHNFGVVAEVADRVLVLESGEICERGLVAEVFANPSSLRTRAMLAASPRLASVCAPL